MVKSIGQLGEEIAEKYLKKKGYKILERNYKRPWGEIDIITEKEEDIIFVEVKTLAGPDFLPEESISPKKKKKLIRASKMYLWQKKCPENQSWQIDVVGIEGLGDNKFRLRHTKKAITE